MGVTWKDLSFIPSAEAIAELHVEWQWLIGEDSKAFLSSVMGDVFLETQSGEVTWLDTGRGRLEVLAPSREAFLAELRGKADEWMMASLVDELHAAGIRLGPGQCYGFKVMPALGGDYAVANVAPMAAQAWYGFSGYVHHQLKDLPDGAHVHFELSPDDDE